MNELNHWHPVLLSKNIKQKPVGIKLCGQEIAVFRTQSGKIGAIEDICSHRKMRLSKGWVEGNRLVCPYHGWNYGCDGKGHSLSTPHLRFCTKNFDAIEKHGLIWIKASQSEAKFPSLDFENYHFVCALEHHINAPLELVVDINSEVEHAATTHTFFGHNISQVSEVEVKFDFSDREVVKFIETMPQKPLPKVIKRLFGISDTDRFVDKIEVHFSPLYKISQLYWENHKTGQIRKERIKSAFFFTPISEKETKWISLYYLASPRWGRIMFHLLQKRVLKHILNYEINRDKWVLENLADRSLEFDPMCLGRFDKTLVENRKRIQSIYRGQRQAVLLN